MGHGAGTGCLIRMPLVSLRFHSISLFFFFLSTFAQREPIHFDALTLTQSGVQWADARSFLLAPRESDLQEKYQEVKTKRTELVTEIHATCPVDSSILPGKTGARKK